MIAFSLREALRSVRQHRGLAFTALFSLTGVLTLSSVALLMAHNAQLAMQMIGDRREMVVYLRDDVSESRRNALTDRLGQLYGRVTFVSKDMAWAEFVQQVGDPSLVEAVDSNPLPASLRIKLKPELLNHDAMEEAAEQVKTFPEVEDVRYGGDWVRRLDDLGNGLRRGAIAVGAIVGLAVLFVMYNTIRLTVLARRPQVEIMSRLGATDGFIAAPFVVEATGLALFAAALSLGIAFVFSATFAAQVVHVVFLPPVWIAAFIGATTMLAWIAALLALTRVLRAVGP